MKKDYKAWHEKKSLIQDDEKRSFFHNREIWFCSLGKNIGYEQDGKGDNFLRPVIIFRKFNQHIFWAIPLTTSKKISPYNLPIGKVQNKIASAIISQLRLIDAKRLQYKIGKVKRSKWREIKNRLLVFIQKPENFYLSPQNEESRARAYSAEAIYTTNIRKSFIKVNTNTKTILLTGAAGFIGSHLCARLLEEGHSVIAVDNLSTGRKENIEPYLNNPNFTFLNHNIIEPLNIRCDFVLNFACPASPPHYQKDPIFTWKTSVIGTMNMLELAKKNNCPILHASTSEVYGDPITHPQPESYWGNVNPIGPRSCYDEGKRAAETICYDFKRQHNLDVRVIRIFNTYGPNMDPNDGRVVSNFIMQAIKNEPITIYGDGSQTRSFQYIDDLTDAILKFLKLPISPNSPINLGNPTEFTILELANLILKLTGSTSQITCHPLPTDDPKQRCPNTTLAKTMLNWKAKTNLESGLIKSIRYFQSLIPDSHAVSP